MHNSFPLFQNHLDLAHSYWKRLLKRGDTAIDATCGNGHDTLILAKTVLAEGGGHVLAYDIQPIAIEGAKARLAEQLDPAQMTRIEFFCEPHLTFEPSLEKGSVALIVYNLGYLPGGNKQITTQTASTIASIRSALPLIKRGGAISITCYPGHAEGALEEQALLEFCSTLSPHEWNCCHHRWLNRQRSPSLLLLQR